MTHMNHYYSGAFGISPLANEPIDYVRQGSRCDESYHRNDCAPLARPGQRFVQFLFERSVEQEAQRKAQQEAQQKAQQEVQKNANDLRLAAEAIRREYEQRFAEVERLAKDAAEMAAAAAAESKKAQAAAAPLLSADAPRSIGDDWVPQKTADCCDVLPTPAPATVSATAGTKHRAQSTSVIVAAAQDKTCVVCMDRERNVVCMPCTHLVLCVQCCSDAPLRKCPVCQRDIEQLIKCIVS